MARITPFSAGQRWYVDRGAQMSYAKPNFWFVILGDAPNNEREKVCLLEHDLRPFEGNASMMRIVQEKKTLLSQYSRNHLKKYGVMEVQEEAAFATSREKCEVLFEKIEPLLKEQNARYARLDVKGGSALNDVIDAMVSGQPLSEGQQAEVDLASRVFGKDPEGVKPVAQSSAKSSISSKASVAQKAGSKPKP